MVKIGLLEIALIEIILLSLIWLSNDYIGTLLSLLFGLLSLIILVISYIVEWIEKSKVPRWYFSLLWITSGVSFGVMILFTWIKGGQYSWLEDIF